MGHVVAAVFWVYAASWYITIVLSVTFKRLRPCFRCYSDCDLVNDAEVNTNVGVDQRVGASRFVFKRKLYRVRRPCPSSRADYFLLLHEVNPLFSGEGSSADVASDG